MEWRLCNLAWSGNLCNLACLVALEKGFYFAQRKASFLFGERLRRCGVDLSLPYSEIGGMRIKAAEDAGESFRRVLKICLTWKFLRACSGFIDFNSAECGRRDTSQKTKRMYKTTPTRKIRHTRGTPE